MSTIAEFRLPAEETALSVVFEYVPTATVELEPSVSKTLPCLWINDVDAEAVEAALDDDPTVDAFELLVEADGRLLYDVSFTPDARGFLDDLLGDEASLLEATVTSGGWQVRMRFRDREDLCRAHDRLVERGINADLRRVTELTDASSPHTRLTPQQQEALAAAFEHGYFEIPRRISMEELAAELGISHQALSERLRRAYETLVDAELQPMSDQPN
ncbi:helix-turn-helix domain-containing protein [Natronobiforma cellulositropha]|uniref:helix-turn-helix domain-containing protein n=1 Tax=Natronobiforma cellulositropha TaxID=1679076 RepID=UPI0021D6090C|nr:helix-turn-helix domain-containing protein [Natronobiforma cellulositropha]